jgi:L-alanine-DL-glutamate epimerase-like enolase superfamily enzyme
MPPRLVNKRVRRPAEPASHHFKIKVGDDLRGGVARIAAVRKAVGEDVTFT